MATDINVSQLIINKLTQAQYDEAKAAGNISESELYFVTDDGEVEIADVIAEHNTSADAHSDIRAELDAKADSSDLNNYLPRTGGEMTGQISMPETIDEVAYSATLSSEGLEVEHGRVRIYAPDRADALLVEGSGAIEGTLRLGGYTGASIEASSDDENTRISLVQSVGDGVIINNVAYPQNNYHAANKKYVDDAIQAAITAAFANIARAEEVAF